MRLALVIAVVDACSACHILLPLGSDEADRDQRAWDQRPDVSNCSCRLSTDIPQNCVGGLSQSPANCAACSTAQPSCCPYW